jgi:hypothetical protein
VFADELRSLHVHAVGINQWWVPLIEFSAGGAVVIGLVAPLAALGLLVIILVASATSGRDRIKAFKPIDRAERIDDWLYLPETLYAVMLIMINGTMTNGGVGQTVSSVDGPVLTVKLKDGDKKIIVGPNVPVTRLEVANKSELKSGVAVAAAAATKKPDGTFTAARIDFGRGDVVP